MTAHRNPRIFEMFRKFAAPDRHARQVEQPAATLLPGVAAPVGDGGAPARATTPTWYARPVDHWVADVHLGSADLAEWPPSLVELELAQAADITELFEVCGSIARANAVLREVRRRRDAETMLGRIA